MSDHERWIVYPLLFLALGAALRPKFTGEFSVPVVVRAPQVQCEALIIVDQERRPRIELTTTQGSPRIVLFGRTGQVLFSTDGRTHTGLPQSGSAGPGRRSAQPPATQQKSKPGDGRPRVDTPSVDAPEAVPTNAVQPSAPRRSAPGDQE